MGFEYISVEPGNPFQAEYKTNLKQPPLNGMTLTPPPSLSSVARDSQGRVRVDHFVGKYKTKSPDGVETESDRHFIAICDPVSRQSIRLDTVEKTATIQGPRFNLPSLLPFKPDLRPQQSFCTRLFSMRQRLQSTQAEDLGHQTLSGFEVVGLRMVHTPAAGGGNEGRPTFSSYNDLWCSDDLGALVEQVFVTGALPGTHRREILMQDIERREPDASLLQIPPDYTIIESVMPGNRTLLPQLIPAPAVQKPQ